MFEISQISDFTIDTMEVDKDHIHLLLDIEPKISVSSIVNRLKVMSTNRLWKKYKDYLQTQFFKGKNIKAHTILMEGHPANTIVKIAQEEGFDMIVIGGRGASGVQKLFLGSVSNAVIHEVKDCSVLIVK